MAIFRYTIENESFESESVTEQVNEAVIRELQGDGLLSPFNGRRVTTSGVVTGLVRKGFFLQTPNVEWDGIGSDAIFVYSPSWQASKGAELVVTGDCVDYIKHDTAKPVTQIHFESVVLKQTEGPTIEPIFLTADFLPSDYLKLAKLLNSLEGMLLAIEPGQTFVAPSNRYGDYVLALDSADTIDAGITTEQGGFIPKFNNELCWLPGFRISNYNHAQRVNVGSKLRSEISGPLNYRVDAYQIVVNDPFEVEANFIPLEKSSLIPSDDSLTIMTLNCFNLDPHVESEEKVTNPRQDVDDDWGQGRFHTLAQAVVLYANTPDIVALQEIQDNDGAEMSGLVDASDTYALLIKTIKQLSGVEYAWIDVPPELNADGGQPGGNIRNAYLYNPERVALVEDSVRVIGRGLECYDDSRKPLVCDFIELTSQQRLSIINIHLASKRHQESIFAPTNPGVDAKLDTRVAQAELIKNEAEAIYATGQNYYITGDFNDTEHSETLKELTSMSGENLVLSLPEVERYDYNHRGKLQVLMHGIVPQKLIDNSQAEYEIIHGNELLGVSPGEDSDKPSDHAYVIAKIAMTA